MSKWAGNAAIGGGLRTAPESAGMCERSAPDFLQLWPARPGFRLGTAQIVPQSCGTSRKFATLFRLRRACAVRLESCCDRVYRGRLRNTRRRLRCGRSALADVASVGRNRSSGTRCGRNFRHRRTGAAGEEAAFSTQAAFRAADRGAGLRGGPERPRQSICRG